ncbi:hypothetical protein PR202_gb08841 [Eleusine coracana subsp. coracana]|uniref:Uncharacterized protein n=1 Tax=Eleusine coracana subsp. coracana TaxID=191504 RepID=A0AAV5EFQ8_ELECO|nr:hypothetical protein PR202_gb08841 [Eleusine coracana subsp. coracana]
MAMEQDELAFKPQWLMQGGAKAAGAASIFAAPSSRPDNQVKGGSSRNHSSGCDNSRQPSSRKSSGSIGSRRPDRDAMVKTRGYANFGRNREKDREKDFNSRGRESRQVAADRDGFQSFSTCKPERDRLNRARLKAETRNKGVAISLNNDSTSRSNADVSSSKSNDVVSSSESSVPGSNAAASTPLNNAAVSTSPSNASVSTSPSNAAANTPVNTASVSTSVSTASVSTSVSTTAVSTSVITAADASRSNAALSAPRSSAALSTSRSSSALTASRSNAALTASRSNAALTASRSNIALSASRSNSVLSASRSNAVVSTPRSSAAGMDFEREFPQLNLEDKNGRQGVSRVPSPGISTPIQNVPLINTSDGWNSVLADLPLLKDAKKSQAASSVLQTAPSKQTEAVSNNGAALSMAETVMQAPLRISTGPQLSIEAQKIEERALRQYTLRPLTPPASKSSVLSSLKAKSARMGDPTGPTKTAQQLKMHSANGSVRAPVKIDMSKLSQSGSFQVLNREQNGTVHTSKDSSNPVSPPAPSVSMEPPKKSVVSQKINISTNELSLPLQGPCGDRKSNARDKHRFFESLRTKSSNGSSTTLETGCQQFPSSLVDVKQDSSLNIGNDQSMFPTGTKCLGNGKCFCEDVNSSEGFQRHLSDNEENNSSMKTDVADGVPQQLEKGEADSLSEPADTGDEEFQLSLSDSGAEGSSFSAPADSDDGFNRSQSGSEEVSSSEATEPEDDEYPAEPPAEDKPFLISLGWREDEVVQPLGLEEIADSVKGCAELEKKLWSMESNANVRIILLNILGRAK